MKQLEIAPNMATLTGTGVKVAYPSGVKMGPDDNLESATAALAPGEEFVLRGGAYFFVDNVTLTANGTASQPITIRAKSGEQPIIEQATSNHNVVEISGSSNLVVRGIEFTGGSYCIRLINSDYITIEECEVHETGDVAISANSGGTYEGLRILRNHIRHTNGTGEGMYLGCNNDACRVSNSLIAGNYTGTPPIDPFPAPGSALIGAGDPAHVTTNDFNGNARNGDPDAGAYAFDASGNPGWKITSDFKTANGRIKTPMPPTDVQAN